MDPLMGRPGSSGSLVVRNAVDRILHEYTAIERERSGWRAEREQLTDEISRLTQELDRTNQKFVALAKRHRLLQMSIRHLRETAITGGKKKKRGLRKKHGEDDSVDGSSAAGKSGGKGGAMGGVISIAYQTDDQKTKWSATLPAALEPESVLRLMRGLDMKFAAGGSALGVIGEAAGGGSALTPVTVRSTGSDGTKSNNSSLGLDMGGMAGGATTVADGAIDTGPGITATDSAPEMKAGEESSLMSKRDSLLSGDMAGLMKKETTKMHLLSQSLRAHMDAVRSVEFYESQDWLLSTGDDGLVHVWDISEEKVSERKAKKTKSFWPVATLRVNGKVQPETAALGIHASDSADADTASGLSSVVSGGKSWTCDRELGFGISTCIRSVNGNNSRCDDSARLIITTGENGNVNVFSVPKIEDLIDLKKKQMTSKKFKYPTSKKVAEIFDGQISFRVDGSVHGDMVWDVLVNDGYHSSNDPLENDSLATMFSTVCADNFVRVFDIEKQCIRCQIENERDTGIFGVGLWNKNDPNSLVCSTNLGNICVLDLRTSAVSQVLSSGYESPILCLEQSNQNGLIYAGCDDGCIRIFDLSAYKLMNNIKAHTDGVSSMTGLHNSESSLMSVSHDCGIRSWYLEQHDCQLSQDFSDMASHLQRFDEGILNCSFNHQRSMAATSGADGVIRLLA